MLDCGMGRSNRLLWISISRAGKDESNMHVERDNGREPFGSRPFFIMLPHFLFRGFDFFFQLSGGHSQHAGAK